MGALVAGFVYFSNNQATNATEPVLMDKIPQSVAAPIAAPKVPEPFTVEKKTREEKNPEFAISMSYPLVKEGDRRADIANTEIGQYMDGAVKTFKDEFFSAKKEGPASALANQWKLTMRYDVPYQSQALLSLRLTLQRDTGGAHSSGEVKTFAVDLQNKKILALDDILLSDVSLKILSDKVITDLNRRSISDPEWIAAGAGAQKKNYQHWYFTAKGLTVVFPPYKVAPYSQGIQEVSIPSAELSSMIKSEYILTPR